MAVIFMAIGDKMDMSLRRARKKYSRLIREVPEFLQLNYIDDRKEVSGIISDMLDSDKSCMIARYGSVELNVICNYLGIIIPEHSFLRYIKGEVNEWWWSPAYLKQLKTNAGFYPITEQNVTRYVKLCLDDASQLDVLGSWQHKEYYVDTYAPECIKVRLKYLEPDFFATDASAEWTQSLKGKKVLVVHPFEETIRKQYEKRKYLFRDSNLLPDFELKTIKAVQSINGSNKFFDWFDALDSMKGEIDKTDFDIAILGCGAYGFNLAAHVKRIGKKAVHLGGATQLLFGIIGNRWANREDYRELFNEYWCRPATSERPLSASAVENACYW